MIFFLLFSFFPENYANTKKCLKTFSFLELEEFPDLWEHISMGEEKV